MAPFARVRPRGDRADHHHRRRPRGMRGGARRQLVRGLCPAGRAETDQALARPQDRRPGGAGLLQFAPVRQPGERHRAAPRGVAPARVAHPRRSGPCARPRGRCSGRRSRSVQRRSHPPDCRVPAHRAEPRGSAGAACGTGSMHPRHGAAHRRIARALAGGCGGRVRARLLRCARAHRGGGLDRSLVRLREVALRQGIRRRLPQPGALAGAIRPLRRRARER